ncbi:DedA family protein, partial [Candidatus Gottesmanbacteria bacterium]|nr:DedA family protein [Candidatus Gottesmanbacteria bacterium]
TGYVGIFFLMLVESALIPVPSEVTMPFAGSLVAGGKFNLFLVVLMGTLGNLVGSLLAYSLGYWGQEAVVRKLIQKYGKYLLITEHEYSRAESWFRKHGEIIVFVSRLLPAVRTFISLPAGIAHMKLRKFIIYTVLGCLPWSFLLTLIGVKLGENWENIGVYFHRFDALIFILLILSVLYYVNHKLKIFKLVLDRKQKTR